MTTLAATAETAPSSTSGEVDDLVEEHRAALLAYARKLLTDDHHLAEDVVQEAFIKAWRHADRLRSREGSMRGWLLKVTRNLIIDRMRSAHVRRESLTQDSPDTALPDQTESLLLSLDVVSLLRDLSPEHQEALVLIYVYGRTVNEVSHILGIPPGTVKSRHHYALHGLRKKRAELGPRWGA